MADGSKQIFRTKFPTCFVNPNAENEYQKIINSGFKMKNLFLCFVPFILSLCLAIIMVYRQFHDHKKDMDCKSDFTTFELEEVMVYINFSIHLTILILTPLTKSHVLQQVYFLGIYVLIVFDFTLFGSYLEVYHEENIIYLLYFMLIHFIMRLLIVLVFKDFSLVFIGSVLVIISKWLLLFPYKEVYYRNYIIHASVSCIFDITLCIFTYTSELNMRNSFYVKYAVNLERNFLFSLINSVKQGFFIIRKGKLIFMNKYIKDLWEKFESIKIRPERASDSFRQEEVFIKTEDFILNERGSDMLGYEVSDFFDKIFMNLFFVHENLSHELRNYLNRVKERRIEFKFEDFENISGFQSGCKNMFICLGKAKWQIEGNIKEYEILFRKSKSLQTEDYHYDFILNDITEIIFNERQTTILNCRSLYLNKIAHEFRNPICNMIELVNHIEEETNNSQNESKDEDESSIASERCDFNIKSLRNICNMLLFLIKDFSFFSRDDNITTSSSQINFSFFDYTEAIEDCVNIFKIKSRMDDKANSVSFNIFYENDINTKIEKIYSDLQIFKSLIFNLLYQAYKYTISGVIVFKVSLIEEDFIVGDNNHFINFEICHNGACINEANLMRNSNSSLVENVFINNNVMRNETVDSFNNNFQLFISNLYAKNLGSRLNFEVIERGEIKYAFKIVSKQDRPNSNINKRVLSLGNIKPLPVISKSIEGKKRNKIISSPLINHNIEMESEGGCFFPCHIRGVSNCTPRTVEREFQMDLPLNLRHSIYDMEMDVDVHIISEKSENNPEPFSVKSIKIDEEMEIKYPDSDNCLIQNNSSEVKSSLKNLFNSTNRTSFSKFLKKDYRVLIVDDEVLIRKTLFRFFTRYSNESNINIEIIQSENCFEALNAIYQNFLENKFIDIMFIDETMPIIKGSELINLLKQLDNKNSFYKIKIISFTSYDSNEKKQYILSQGADYILSKPLTYDDFRKFSQSSLFI